MSILQLAADAAPQNSTTGFLTMLIPFALMFVLLYFLIIRPQRKKEQERLQMIQNVKKDDYILTTGGIYGAVVSVKDNEVVIRIDDATGAKVKLAKSAIIGVEKQSSSETDAEDKPQRKPPVVS
jgi:preprotein translocase subunit YajC